jgi:hypothetical protein
VERSYKLLGSRSFHVTSHLDAKPKPRPSPRIAKFTLGGGRVQNVQKQYNPQESLPPLAMLQSATKSGVMDIEPAKATEFLTEYLKRVGNLTRKGWEEDLCSRE